MKKFAETYDKDQINLIRGALSAMLETANDHPRHKKADVVKLLRTEIKALLDCGLSFEEIAAGLRNEVDFEMAPLTLRRYYAQINTPVPKGTTRRRVAPGLAESKQNGRSAPRTVAPTAIASQNKPVEMPERGAL